MKSIREGNSPHGCLFDRSPDAPRKIFIRNEELSSPMFPRSFLTAFHGHIFRPLFVARQSAIQPGALHCTCHWGFADMQTRRNHLSQRNKHMVTWCLTSMIQPYTIRDIFSTLSAMVEWAQFRRHGQRCCLQCMFIAPLIGLTGSGHQIFHTCIQMPIRPCLLLLMSIATNFGSRSFAGSRRSCTIFRAGTSHAQHFHS